MYKIFHIFNVLKLGKHLNQNDADEIIKEDNISSEQWSSLSVLLALKLRNSYEETLFKHSKLISNNPEKWYKIITDAANYTDRYEEIIYRTINKESIGKELINWTLDTFENDTIDTNFFSFWLMLLNSVDISEEDTLHITKKLLNSGIIQTYKEEQEFYVRRYPTGGMSEKVALILPSLLAATHDDFNIKAHFLVAKTLSHTGGTVDKLSVFNGFSIPESNKSIINILDDFGVVMASTGKNTAPLDKKLYAFRSITGTVEAKSLIISSIASKQMALPTDFLLLDIRYGSGAFIKNKQDGEVLGRQLSKILQETGQTNEYVLTNMSQPNGSAIGNFLEVIESVDIMDPNFNINIFNEQKKIEQLSLVLKFYKIMMSNYDSAFDWTEYGKGLFGNGKVITAFWRLLGMHGVSKKDSDKIQRDILEYFDFESLLIYEITASKRGILTDIKQKDLGYIINYDSALKKAILDNGGIIIKRNVGTQVNKGNILAKIYSRKKLSNKLITQIQLCFVIEKEI
ncbi:hypothetical protein G6H54_002179 [Listeria monocytogenes]|nr:hypothetical protein [Listeria monocytogenes]EEO7553711.1 hypothetical protein [Listeria monocytogenes]EEO9089447.1 hypothetical protein [Listeria monocytogenes]